MKQFPQKENKIPILNGNKIEIKTTKAKRAVFLKNFTLDLKRLEIFTYWSGTIKKNKKWDFEPVFIINLK